MHSTFSALEEPFGFFSFFTVLADRSDSPSRDRPKGGRRRTRQRSSRREGVTLIVRKNGVSDEIIPGSIFVK